MNIFRRKQQVSQTSLASKASSSSSSSSSTTSQQPTAPKTSGSGSGPTLSASSNSSSGSSSKTNEVIQQTMTSISPIAVGGGGGKMKQAIPPVVANASNLSAAATGLVPIVSSSGVTQSLSSVSLASSHPPSSSPQPQVTTHLPSINSNTPPQRITPSSLFGGSASPAKDGGEMNKPTTTANIRTKPTPPNSLFMAPSSSSSSSSSSSNANSKIIRNKMNNLRADLDSMENGSQAKLEPAMSTLTIGDNKISRPSALTPFSSAALPASPSDFNMPNAFLGTPRTRTRLVDFHLGASESVPSYTRSINNQLSSATSSDSDKNANFSDFVNHATSSSSSHRSLHKFTPNGLHPLQLPPTSSSRSSSTSSMSLSLSSSSSSIPPSSYSTVCRLEAVNSEKFREILKNNGYLTINGERIKSTMNDLTPICELGRGTCGHVMKMKHISSGAIMAVKQMSISGIQEENKRIIMDLDIAVKSHDCKEIVKCLGYFISESDVWICMELMSMCFDKLLKLKKVPLPEPILGKLTVSTLNALTYLKDVHHIIHRDVKPSNILIDENGEIKLCDFGISGNLINSNAHTRSNTGCAGYMAPERIEIDQSNPVYDIRADVWSMGISLVELATGEYPYKGCRNEFEVMSKIIESPAPRLEGDQFTDDFKSFIEKCLIRDVRQRPKYNVLLQHPFVHKYKSEQVDVRGWFRSILAENQMLTVDEDKEEDNSPLGSLALETTTDKDNGSVAMDNSDEALPSSESSSTTPTVANS